MSRGFLNDLQKSDWTNFRSYKTLPMIAPVSNRTSRDTTRRSPFQMAAVRRIRIPCKPISIRDRMSNNGM
jgi:hypothetical protein